MKQPIEMALRIARENLKEIRTVTEWAEKMGYENPKYFSREFRNYFGNRPLRILNLLRSIKSIELLKTTDKTVFEISYFKVSIGDEKRFCQFLRYHTGYSPRNIRAMKNDEVSKLLEKLRSKIKE